MTKELIRQRISNAIYVLRFPLAVMVVAIHTYYNEGLTARGGVGIPFSGRWAHELIHLLSITLTDCAVPLFFVISGYLYFVKEKKFTWGGHFIRIKGKVFTILLPYMAWNIVACIMNPSRFIESSPYMRIAGFWSMTPTVGQGAGPWVGPLWFMRDLFIVMLFAPLIEWLVEKLRVWMLLLFAVPYYIFDINNIIPGISTMAFMWFSLGALLSLKYPQLLVISNKKILIPLTVVFFILRQGSYSFNIGYPFCDIINHLWIFVCMMFYYTLGDIIARNTSNMDKWKKLAAGSFVIYAMHRLVNSKITALGLMIIGKPSISGLEAAILYVATIISTVSICYVTHLIISKNKYLSMIFEGSRNR